MLAVPSGAAGAPVSATTAQLLVADAASVGRGVGADMDGWPAGTAQAVEPAAGRLRWGAAAATVAAAMTVTVATAAPGLLTPTT